MLHIYTYTTYVYIYIYVAYLYIYTTHIYIYYIYTLHIYIHTTYIYIHYIYIEREGGSSKRITSRPGWRRWWWTCIISRLGVVSSIYFWGCNLPICIRYSQNNTVEFCCSVKWHVSHPMLSFPMDISGMGGLTNQSRNCMMEISIENPYSCILIRHMMYHICNTSLVWYALQKQRILPITSQV